MKKVRVGQSAIEGVGLFADEPIQKGEVVLVLTGERLSTDEAKHRFAEGGTRYDDPLQVQENEYLILDEVSNAANHSCDPNAGVRGESELFALRNIATDEEITYDYSTVDGTHDEWTASWTMGCRCGAKNCRKTIGSWATLPPERLAWYSEARALPDFIKAQVESK